MRLIDKYRVLFTSKEGKKIAFLFVGILLMGVLEVAGIASILPFMAVVSSPEVIHQNEYLSFAYHFFGFTSDNKFLVGVGMMLIIMLTLSNGFTAFMSWRITKFNQMQGYNLSVRLMKKYLSQPYVFFLNRNSADMGKNILSEVNRCIAGVILPGMQALSKLIVAIFIFTFLLLVNPLLVTSSMVVIGCAYWLIFKLARNRLQKIGLASTKVVYERFKIVNEAMSGIKDLKLRGTELEFLDRFSYPSEAFARYSIQSNLISTLPRYALETIGFGGIVVIVIYLISSGHNYREVIPMISLFALACYRLMPALQQMYSGITRIKYNLPALDILIEDLSCSADERTLKKQKPKPIPFERILQLKSIHFHYPNMDKAVINGLNLDIHSNTTVGLVGATGSGKTTLIDILLGLLLPESGELLVDGKEINSENLTSWQQNLGYVPQSIYLTDDSIERNIAFAIPDDEIDIAKVKEAAKLAELDAFIQTLPDGYQTHVGERGVRLSGGQRQRFGIARALYSNPKVLVLDEATSSLDSITENVIMDAIHNLSHKKTIIMIAHRLSTVKECDAIHMMEKGRIVQSGTYDELISHNAQFRKMANN